MLGFYSRRHPTAHFVHLNFNAAAPVQRARHPVGTAHALGQAPPCLLIDCRAVACLRTRGLGYFVDQLLMIRRTGAGIQLLHADGSLRRALRLLRLDTLFELPADAPRRGRLTPRYLYAETPQTHPYKVVKSAI